MLKLSGVVAVFALTLITTVSATQPGPYAGQEQREIKAFSSDEVQSYLTGKGAGFAKAAELNHYPGPAHVLELADQLRLSKEQKARTKAVFTHMQQEAIRHGQALIEKERELDQLFAAGTITPDSLRATLNQIGALQTEVRRSHLQAHIEQKAILTKAQVAKYDELRGYSSRHVRSRERCA